MHRDYCSPAIRILRDRRIRHLAPPERLAEVERIEYVLARVRVSETYQCRELLQRISRDAVGISGKITLRGDQARHDLMCLIEDLSEAAQVRAESLGEPVWTIEELARRFRVSKKTISRWRRLGLVGRRLLFDDRKRLGFLESSVERFIAQNPQRVRRGANFSRLSEEERQEIVAETRRLRETGLWPAEVIKRVACRSGRSMETVRYTVKRFDQAHPEAPVFPSNQGRLCWEAKQEIFRHHRAGESVESLARRYRRAKTAIYRVLAEVRARRVLELPLQYIPNEQFCRAESSESLQREILAPMPEGNTVSRKPRDLDELPHYLASLYDIPLLTREQEAHLFRKMNYLKYRASRIRDSLESARPSRRRVDQIETLYEDAMAVKNLVVRANLRLVVSVAKRFVSPTMPFFDLISDGNMSVIRAVDKFDFARGNKFSTYASWALMKNFARTIPMEHRQHDRYRTSYDELFEATPDFRTDQHQQEHDQFRRESAVTGLLARLDEREREILTCRFGLRRGQEPLTLKQVGAVMGVTKERIRQLESRALGKLRKAAEDDQLVFVG